MARWIISAALAALLGGCEASTSATLPPPIAAAPEGWRYGVATDQMRGTSTRWAELPSVNEPSLSFPYEGGSPLLLQLTKGDGSTETRARLLLRNGQFDCSNSYGRTCALTIKIDDAPPQEIRGIEDQCGEHQCLLLGADLLNESNPPAVLALIRRGADLTIETPLYRFGSYQYRFKPSGLVWDTEPETVPRAF